MISRVTPNDARLRLHEESMKTHPEADTPGLRDADGQQFVWSEVEPGFYAGSCAGNFLGYIDQNLRGIFVAHDMTSHVIGEFSTLEEAMESLTALFLSRSEEEV